jgi:orotidine-5'-phosphate decarboxylase
MGMPPRIFCAVDTNDIDRAIDLTHAVNGLCGIKLGLEFFNAFGIQGVQKIMKQAENTPLFLDLKYHDIPNTVAGAIKAVTKDLNPAYINIHASGGLAMMAAAKDACPPETKLLAVTILTSIDNETLETLGQGNSVKAQVRKLAKLTKEAGLDGVVCSPHEIETIREVCGNDFITMVPGIRPEGAASQDQKRVMTPNDAVSKGATHLVIGRPITQSDNPRKTIQNIIRSL